jgi:hypothetical protein
MADHACVHAADALFRETLLCVCQHHCYCRAGLSKVGDFPVCMLYNDVGGLVPCAGGLQGTLCNPLDDCLQVSAVHAGAGCSWCFIPPVRAMAPSAPVHFQRSSSSPAPIQSPRHHPLYSIVLHIHMVRMVTWPG